MQPLTRRPPKLLRDLDVSSTIELYDIRQRIAITGGNPQRRDALPIPSYAPEPRAIVRQVGAIGAEAIPHGLRLFGDCGDRVQRQKIVTGYASGAQPHVGDRLTTEVHMQRNYYSPVV